MELVKTRDKTSSAATQIKGFEEELAGALAEVSALQVCDDAVQANSCLALVGV